MADSQEGFAGDAATATTTADQPGPTPGSPALKRKRDSVDDSGDRDEGRDSNGNSNARRTSFNQTSPNMPSVEGFMAVNASGAPPQNPPQPQSTNYYQPINMAPQQPGHPNGTDSGSAQLAASALGSLLPLQNANLAFNDPPKPQLDGGYQVQEHQQSVGDVQQIAAAAQAAAPQGSQQQTPQNPKPQVGTEEWHRVRRDNHKEVERRRRETINEGINELAKIVPGCEKNKGSILQRAVQYIQQLKETEAQNIEKWTLEKLLTEQAIQELSQSNEKLKKDLDRAWREAETWKKSCLQAGVTRDGSSQPGGNVS